MPLLCQNPKGASEQEWLEKAEMAKNYLNLIESLNMGVIKDKGRTLFELSNATLALAKIRRQNEVISENEFRDCLVNDLFPILCEITYILRFDCVESFEGKLCEAAKFYLKTFQDYTKSS